MQDDLLVTEEPLVSVIMPTYNTSRFIGQAINSLLGQTYSNWELIIVDDASTDRTSEIVRSYSDPRVQYYRLTDRKGFPSAVRNIGLGLARGEFLGFLDSDDEYYPTALETLSRALMGHPEWWIAQGYETMMSEDGQRFIPNPSILKTVNQGIETYHFSACHRSPSLKAFLLCHNPCLFPATLVRRAVFEQLGLYNEGLLSGEDQEYFLKLYLAQLENHPVLFPLTRKKIPVGMVPALIFRYRQRSGSLVHSIGTQEKAIEDNIQLLDWFFDTAQPLPIKIRRLKGQVYANRYSYAAKALLSAGHKDLSRKWIHKAWRNQSTSRRYWVLKLLPLLLGSFCPLFAHRFLTQMKEGIRCLYYSVSSPQGEVSL